jgi:flagellar FliL protein
MATNPKETAAAEPAEASTEAEPSPTPGGFKAWLPLLITVIAMPLLAYSMTSFVLLPKLQKGLGITPVAAKEAGGKKGSGAAAKKESYIMNKLLVNVAGTMGGRYLLVSISLTGTDADFKTKIQEVEPQLRDMAGGVLRLKTLADLEKPTAQNLIRTELISGFNNILGGTVVQDIYFTEFAIQ